MLCSITAFKVLTCELFKPMSKVAPAHFTFSFLEPPEVHVVSLGSLLCPCLKVIGHVFFIVRVHACPVSTSSWLLQPPCCCGDYRLSLPSQAAEPVVHTPIRRSDYNSRGKTLSETYNCLEFVMCLSVLCCAYRSTTLILNKTPVLENE